MSKPMNPLVRVWRTEYLRLVRGGAKPGLAINMADEYIRRFQE